MFVCGLLKDGRAKKARIKAIIEIGSTNHRREVRQVPNCANNPIVGAAMNAAEPPAAVIQAIAFALLSSG
jgi:hypothetical protein